jgi:VWFA-related protein
MRLTKILPVQFVLAAAVLAQFAVPATKIPPPTQPAADQSVSVVISATDSKGMPLHQLSKDQVSVSDSNQPAQTLTVVDASELPLDLGIVLLASKDRFGQEQAAATDLARKVMRPGKDKAFVITAGGDTRWTDSHIPWLTDASSVAEAVHGLDKNTGLPDLFNYQLSTDTAGLARMAVQTYNLGNSFSAFDVIWAMMKNDPRPARRVTMIFRSATAHSPGLSTQASYAADASPGSMATGGGPSAPIDSSQNVTSSTEATHNRVILLAQSMGISFFTVGIDDALISADMTRNKLNTDYMPTHGGGNDGHARAYDQNMDRNRELQYSAGRDNVNRIADETGGRSYWPSKKNYTDAVASIVNELSARYMVSFAPPAGSSAGQIHTLKVQVAGASHVSAPRAYIAQSQ